MSFYGSRNKYRIEESDWKRRHGRKAEVEHKIIEIGESLLNIVWYKADERRAASLEVIT